MTQEMFDEIMQRFGSGEHLSSLSQEFGVATSTLFRMMRIPSNLQTYNESQSHRAETFAEQVILIADDENEEVQRSVTKLRARQWYASKILSAKYGDKLDVAVNHSIDLGKALENAKNRTAPRHEIAQVIDITDQSQRIASKGEFDASLERDVIEFLSDK